jgi:hypothetical protein
LFNNGRRGVRCPTVLAVWALLALLAASSARADIITQIGGDTRNFVVLYDGLGSRTLNQNNGAINGNIGIGGTGKFAATGPGTINGNIDFSAACAGTYPTCGGHFGSSNTTINGTVNYGQADVANDLTDVNHFSAVAAAEAGTALSVNINNGQTQVINASSGILDGHGNRVFNVTSFNFNGGSTLVVNGDTAGDNIIFNFPGLSPQFKGTMLFYGITADQVAFNITGGGTLTVNTNGDTVQGIFVDPNGSVSVSHSNVYGRIFGGDESNMQLVSGEYINAPTPEPAAVVLFGTVILACLPLVKRKLSRSSGKA